MSIVWCSQLVAQTLPKSDVLTLNQERLYVQSSFGKRVAADIRQREAALASENRRIEAQLISEEQRLTDERAETDPEAFRELAADFDERVTSIRNAQDQKVQAIRDFADSERSRFFRLAIPVLAQMVDQAGAAVILDSGAVLFSVGQIDVTEAAVLRVDEAIGAAPLPEDTGPLPAQRPARDP